MMLWLHLFSNLEIVEKCRWLLLYLNDKPLVYSITRIASSCVPIYIFLGGYGLACVWQQNSDHQMNVARRALALMVNFWLVCALFIPLGCIFNPSRYPESMTVLLLNITGISNSYNGAWWFLLPYVILTLFSPRLIRFLMETNWRSNILTLILLLICHVMSYVATDNLHILHSSPLYLIITILNFLFMLFFFSVGVLFVKFNILEHLCKRLKPMGNMCWFLLLLMLSIKMLLGNSSLINLPFVLFLIPLLLSVHLPRKLEKLLAFFGNHSTNMWLTHYFFSYYVFELYIYRLQYPLLIFVTLIFLSLGSSYIIQIFLFHYEKSSGDNNQGGAQKNGDQGSVLVC